MKRFVLAIFGLHLLLASMCIMPAPHAVAAPANTHVLHESTGSSDCPDCDHVAIGTKGAETDDSPCAGGACIFQASQPEAPAFISPVFAAVIPSIDAPVFIPVYTLETRSESTVPIRGSLTKTIVLRL
jgi:hypothetical protein